MWGKEAVGWLQGGQFSRKASQKNSGDRRSCEDKGEPVQSELRAVEKEREQGKGTESLETCINSAFHGREEKGPETEARGRESSVSSPPFNPGEAI